MKFLFDYFPIICFFVAYKFWGIYIATAAAMVVSALQVAIYWIRFRRFEKFHVITLIFILLLGSFTLVFTMLFSLSGNPRLFIGYLPLCYSVAIFLESIHSCIEC